MIIPGFTAEASVYRTTQSYRATTGGSLGPTASERNATTRLQLQVHRRVHGVSGGMPVRGGACIPDVSSHLDCVKTVAAAVAAGRRWRPRPKSALRLSGGDRVPRRMRQGARRRPHPQRGLC